MQTINKADIENEFYSTSWEHDYKRRSMIYRAVVGSAFDNGEEARYNKEKSVITENDIEFVMNFDVCMNNALMALTENKDLEGYLNIRQEMARLKASPEDIDYGVFCNIQNRVAPARYNNINCRSIRSMGYIPFITRIEVENPDTVVFFNDGTKSVVHCENKDKFDPERGIYLAILKKAVGVNNFIHLMNLMEKINSSDNTESAKKTTGTRARKRIDDFFEELKKANEMASTHRPNNTDGSDSGSGSDICAEISFPHFDSEYFNCDIPDDSYFGSHPGKRRDSFEFGI